MKFFKKATAISLAVLSTVSTTTFVSAGKAKPELPASPLKRCRTIRSQLRYSRNRQILRRNPKLLEALGGTSKVNRMNPDTLNKKIEEHRIKFRIKHNAIWFNNYYLANDLVIDDPIIDNITSQVNRALCQDVRDNKDGINICSDGSNVTVVGDTHGDFDSTKRIVKYFLKRLEKDSNEKILFLGDYVDKGAESVKNFVIICALKATFPNNVYMIRGNHEDLSQNKIYGLFDEMNSKYSDCGGSDILAPKFDSVYKNLPLSVVLDKNIFCAHGGIPQPSYTNPNQYAIDLMWSDPDLYRQVISPNGFQSNQNRGGGGNLFNLTALENFLQNNQFSLVIRAHQAVTPTESFRISKLYHDRLLTVFSAQSHMSTLGDNTKGFVLTYNRKTGIQYKDIYKLPNLVK